jgi:hypothetical protein
MSEFKSGRGGRREGAGRPTGTTKPGKKLRVSYRLARDVVEYLRAHHEPAARVIERAVRALMRGDDR